MSLRITCVRRFKEHQFDSLTVVLRRQEIDSQPAEIECSESIPSLPKSNARNRFLDSIKIYKCGLSTYIVELDL